MTTAAVTELAPGQVSFGYCYSNVAGLVAAEPVCVRLEGGPSIYCTVSWYMENILQGPNRVALDSWQCAALGARNGDLVIVESLRSADLPEADFADLRLVHPASEPAHYADGLTSFLVSNRYLLYPGLRFCYQAPTYAAPQEYEVASVLAGGHPVTGAKPSARLAYSIRPGGGAAEWAPSYHRIGGLQPVIELSAGRSSCRFDGRGTSRRSASGHRTGCCSTDRAGPARPSLPAPSASTAARASRS